MDRQRIGELRAREAAGLAERTRASEAMFGRAARSLSGGVASSYHRREPWPVYLARGQGARAWDLDGNEYLDFHNGFGAMIQGHAHPAVEAAVTSRYARGTHFGATTEEAVTVAEELALRFGLPSWRFTNSGTESTMNAIRIARAFTGREDVVKLLGAYHGHDDTTIPWTDGVPRSTVEHVHGVEFNDAQSMEERIAELGDAGRTPACVIMEAAMTSIGVVPPEPGYLDAVRALTRSHGVVLILDEVKTGLTIAAGGAVERFGVEPDLVTLAKSLGAGLPAGAIGMSAELAAFVEHGRVPQAGTFNGNPLSMAAARASLDEALTPAAYERLERLGERLVAGCERVLAARGLAARCTGLGSKGCVSHGPERVVDHASYRRRRDEELAELVWLWCMNRGLLVTPGREQEWSLTVAHDEAAVDRYVEVFDGLAAELTT
jgi:glutamate-1-semialdehyde 2,1-aminomutase